jgi:two-component sensor histidine kinase
MNGTVQTVSNDTAEPTADAARWSDLSSFFPEPSFLPIALQEGSIGVWLWDMASNRISWSNNLEALHRVPNGTFDGTFSFFENDIHPDDRAAVLASIQEAVRSHTPHRALYRLPPKDDGEEHWIEALGTVILENGKPARMIGTCRDASSRVKLHRELRIRARQQEAVARLGERALTESDLQKFLEETVATISEILDVDLVKILELVPGDAELLLRAGVGWKDGMIGVAHVGTSRDTQAGFTLASGGPVVVDHLATETRFSGAELLHAHGVTSGVTIPIAGRDGRAYGVLGTHSTRRRKFTEYDVSFVTSVANVIAGAIQRRQLDRRQELMIRELRHRSGNLFSQLLALFSQTAKSSKSLEELVPKYEARVLALANAHRLVTEGGWKSASLTELLNTLLAPFLDRITFQGPDVFLEPDATFGLSMAMHELTTNASKHGSLSEHTGRVDIVWAVGRTHLGLTLTLDWKELDGPSPARTRRPGFGTKLITMVIERQLNGSVTQSYEPDGLQARLIVPLTHERWPGSPVRSLSPDQL